MFADDSMAFRLYNELLTADQKASGCVACGECLEHCPQNIAIIEELRKVEEKLGVGSRE
jgi:predicted aldo/keto reductase-like oxidoreductase